MEIKAQSSGHLYVLGNDNPSLSSDVDKQVRARSLVYGYLRTETNGHNDLLFSDVVIVWFSKTLQNWKALVAVPEKSDLYFEVTYNGDKKENYLEVYKKIQNLRIAD